MLLWVQGSLRNASLEGTSGAYWIAIGALLGLVAFYCILWQLLLIGRVGWIERVWGHDRLSHAHHLLGLTAIGLLIPHPLLLVSGYMSVAGTRLGQQVMLFLTNYEDVLAATVAYVLFLVIVGMTLTIIRKRLRYEVWYFIHVTLYLAIILAFNHQLSNGHDLAHWGAALYWQILFWGTLAMMLWYRFLTPVRRYYRHRFVVERTMSETHDVTSVIITGRDIAELHARAGQFIIVRFLVRGWWWEAHPFSLSEMPDGTRLRMTIKAVGDFTRRIPALVPGTPVLIEGPLGRLTLDRAHHRGVVLIAGGIGITPLRALFEQCIQEHRPVTLLYAARSKTDFALRHELDALASEHADALVHYIPSDEMGYMTAAMVQEYVPDITQRSVFLCGPPPMMKVVRSVLATLGVHRKNIFFEKFQLG